VQYRLCVGGGEGVRWMQNLTITTILNQGDFKSDTDIQHHEWPHLVGFLALFTEVTAIPLTPGCSWKRLVSGLDSWIIVFTDHRRAWLTTLTPTANNVATCRNTCMCSCVCVARACGAIGWRLWLRIRRYGARSPHGPKQSEVIYSVHLNRQDYSGGSELWGPYSSINWFAGVSIMWPAAP
jgi:hypothetical protein